MTKCILFLLGGYVAGWYVRDIQHWWMESVTVSRSKAAGREEK